MDTAAAAPSGGLFSEWAAAASSFTRKAADVAGGVFLPTSGLVGEATAKAVTATGAGAERIQTAAADAVQAAGTGIKVGFGGAVFVVLLLAGLYVMGLFRNATR